MPYISTERVKEIREAIKKTFPDYKFSVTREHSSGVRIAIMEADIDFETTHSSVNHFYIKDHYQGKAAEVLQKITDIAENGNATAFEDADYGSVPKFYVTIEIGQWNKPCKQLTPSN
jgi:hypothetical protein